MWFRNLQIYQLDPAAGLEEKTLQDAIESQRFKPCRGLDTHRSGWVPPLGRHSEMNIHSCNGRMMLCMRRQEKILPAQVLREAVEDKVASIHEQEQRSVGRKEKNEIKDEIVVDLLPRAFSKSSLTYGYIDPDKGWIIIDTASANRAEEWLGLLRDSLGSLQVTPLATEVPAQQTMTRWLVSNAPQDLQVTDQCELKEPGDKGGIIRMRGMDLQSSETRNHLEHHKEVTRLSLEWRERIGFILHEDLSIRRLRFLDLVMDQAADIDTEDEAARFDADFALMAAELAAFIPDLCRHIETR